MSDSMRPHRQHPTRLPRPWDSPGKNTGVGCHFLLQCLKGKVKVKSLSCVWLLATPWTAAYQAPLPMGFSRQEYWSGVPLPSPKVIYMTSNILIFQMFLSFILGNTEVFSQVRSTNSVLRWLFHFCVDSLVLGVGNLYILVSLTEQSMKQGH